MLGLIGTVVPAVVCLWAHNQAPELCVAEGADKKLSGAEDAAAADDAADKPSDGSSYRHRLIERPPDA